ncbi:MAG TPA: ABC transporter substrate-binding protein, partial [Chloroflexota bacterium]
AAPSQVYIYKLIGVREVQSVADLKGKKLGISSTGGSADVGARVVLRQAGLDPAKDVTLLQVGDVATRQAALLNGAVQAIMDAPPQSLKVEADPRFHVLLDLTAANLPAVNATVVGRRSWVAANRSTVQKYVDSIVQGAARVKRDKALSVAVLQKYAKVDDPQALDAGYEFFSRAITAQPLPRPRDYADTIEQLGQINPKLRGFEPATIMDDSFVKDALSRGLDKA